MKNEKNVRFRQSLADFPVTVELGKDKPAWGLRRWVGDEGLWFVPPGDEGYSLRGDKRRLVYKGQQRSHRFTILDDCAFEYDCILEKEPEKNVITLFLEGAEKYDFFRQPDFVPDPFLKGSYAVYKKDTLIGEGTGKLCHIHRPEIIDALGRRCWGDLSVIGNRLFITIPESWLTEAKYPVVVDPTIGTTTVGSQYEWIPEDDELRTLAFEGELPVNRFLVPETIDGICTAYFYVNEDDGEAGGRGVIYSDNANKPQYRRSKNETFINMRVNGSNPKGWRSGTFASNTSISSGSYIWFGCFTDFFWLPRFDYGTKLYSAWWYDVGDSIPEIHPLHLIDYYFDFKLSMYFTYTSAQNYVRTLTQGVTLNDSRKLMADYKREMVQTVNGSGLTKAAMSLFRQCVMNAANSMNLSRILELLRSSDEQISITDKPGNSRNIPRTCEEMALVSDDARRSQGFIRGLIDGLKVTDSSFYPVLFVRSITDTQNIVDTYQQWSAYIRGLYDEAGNIAETEHQAEYYRTETETVKAYGSVFRGLIIFIRLLTTSLVRDFILRRFLVAKEELVLKSCITRDIILDSKIS